MESTKTRFPMPEWDDHLLLSEKEHEGELNYLPALCFKTYTQLPHDIRNAITDFSQWSLISKHDAEKYRDHPDVHCWVSDHKRWIKDRNSKYYHTNRLLLIPRKSTAQKQKIPADNFSGSVSSPASTEIIDRGYQIVEIAAEAIQPERQLAEVDRLTWVSRKNEPLRGKAFTARTKQGALVATLYGDPNKSKAVLSSNRIRLTQENQYIITWPELTEKQTALLVNQPAGLWYSVSSSQISRGGHLRSPEIFPDKNLHVTMPNENKWVPVCNGTEVAWPEKYENGAWHFKVSSRKETSLTLERVEAAHDDGFYITGFSFCVNTTINAGEESVVGIKSEGNWLGKKFKLVVRCDITGATVFERNVTLESDFQLVKIYSNAIDKSTSYFAELHSESRPPIVATEGLLVLQKS